MRGCKGADLRPGFPRHYLKHALLLTPTRNIVASSFNEPDMTADMTVNAVCCHQVVLRY